MSPRNKESRIWRWSSPESLNKFTEKSKLPVVLPSNLSESLLEEYATQFRLDEIADKLKSGDIYPSYRERSPSPPPIYGSEGKRMNTREYRYRRKLQLENDALVEAALSKFAKFEPPTDWRRPTKFVDKIYLPVKDFPLVNFIGLIIGPRGNTLKKIESETGAKVSIRGKGSVKEGRIGGPQPQDEEDLHCLLIADSQKGIDDAIKHINRIVEVSVSTTDAENTLKRNQLRELASLNGTLREYDGPVCAQCGQTGHRRSECPERQKLNIAQMIVCAKCGAQGHLKKDCMAGADARNGNAYGEQLESEFAKFMQEVNSDSSMPMGVSPVPSSAIESSAPPWAL